MKEEEKTFQVALAQIAPVWLDRDATLTKVVNRVEEAGKAGARLVVFGEALIPGYPFWLALTGGAEWDSPVNKALHRHYLENAVCIEEGHLNGVCQAAAAHDIAVYLGIVERPLDRGGHSLYASLVYIDQRGEIRSVHRKLRPTYDERLTWSPGDGHGLVVHPLGPFTVGGLNCWENWMPLPRASLYAQGENLHIAVWPGSDHNTRDITRFIARESRSYVVSVSALMRKSDFPVGTPHLEKILKTSPELLTNGGSCVAGPNGEWLLEPVASVEGIWYVNLDHQRVLEERQNFDPSGHYSRPDVTRLTVNRDRQQVVNFDENH